MPNNVSIILTLSNCIVSTISRILQTTSHSIEYERPILKTVIVDNIVDTADSSRRTVKEELGIKHFISVYATMYKHNF